MHVFAGKDERGKERDQSETTRDLTPLEARITHLDILFVDLSTVGVETEGMPEDGRPELLRSWQAAEVVVPIARAPLRFAGLVHEC